LCSSRSIDGFSRRREEGAAICSRVTTTRLNQKRGDEIYIHKNDETDEHEGTRDSSWFRHPDHGLLTRLHITSASPLPELLLARHGKRGLEEQRDQQSDERGGRFCNSHGRHGPSGHLVDFTNQGSVMGPLPHSTPAKGTYSIPSPESTLPSPREFTGKTPRMDCPGFDGEGPLEWKLKCESYFRVSYRQGHLGRYYCGVLHRGGCALAPMDQCPPRSCYLGRVRRSSV
jgi:hypothetical protein